MALSGVILPKCEETRSALSFATTTYRILILIWLINLNMPFYDTFKKLAPWISVSKVIIKINIWLTYLRLIFECLVWNGFWIWLVSPWTVQFVIFGIFTDCNSFGMSWLLTNLIQIGIFTSYRMLAQGLWNLLIPIGIFYLIMWFLVLHDSSFLS